MPATELARKASINATSCAATHPAAAQDVALMDAFLASSVAGIAR